jgi:hypothetical protein
MLLIVAIFVGWLSASIFFVAVCAAAKRGQRF